MQLKSGSVSPMLLKRFGLKTIPLARCLTDEDFFMDSFMIEVICNLV